MEASFADAANNHHFKRARWRRLWRQQIQDYLIAATQNVRILLAHQTPKRSAAAAQTVTPLFNNHLLHPTYRCIELLQRLLQPHCAFKSLSEG